MNRVTSVEVAASVNPLGAQCAFPTGLELSCGLTKREYIATMALQGILARAYNDASYDGAARDAVVHADHLLVELAKEGS